MDKIIGVKRLRKELKQISDQVLDGISFVVVKNSKPVFRIVPLENNESKKYSWEELKSLRVKMGEKNLSKKNDNYNIKKL
ncbi:hypothetical protein KAI92_05215 [Candidatus Parcubacteria bacterium]|nr:hypothetical protein [Candidatus Parcubacteria bacterium]